MWNSIHFKELRVHVFASGNGLQLLYRRIALIRRSIYMYNVRMCIAHLSPEEESPTAGTCHIHITYHTHIHTTHIHTYMYVHVHTCYTRHTQQAEICIIRERTAEVCTNVYNYTYYVPEVCIYMYIHMYYVHVHV